MSHVRIISTNIKNLPEIVDKINKLTDLCSIRYGSQNYIYNVHIKHEEISDASVSPSLATFCTIKLLDIKELFENSDAYTVSVNNPFQQVTKISPYEVMMNHIKNNNKVYHLILEFINKLLYSFPTALSENDFLHMNDLYKAITGDDNQE